ncbi:hypothetical protein GGI12_002194 [Dipsacomyces acuminosporus]|nr:hypothetical protein GGI12_002194 [Dipsacomyces acuminosporus]
MASQKRFPGISSTCRDFDDLSYWISPFELPGCIRASPSITGSDGNYREGQVFDIYDDEKGYWYFMEPNTNRYLAFKDSSNGVEIAFIDETPTDDNRIRFHVDAEFKSLWTISRWNSDERVTIERTETGLGHIGFSKNNPLFIFQVVAIES